MRAPRPIARVPALLLGLLGLLGAGVVGGCVGGEGEPPPPPPPLETPYSVDPPSCDAGAAPLGSFATCSLQVTNVSDVEVALTAATSGPPFLVVVVGGFAALAPGDSVTVNVNAVPRDLGVATGELALGPGRLVVPLTVEGLPPPEVVVSVAPDDVVAGSTVTLDASASDAEIYEWTLAQEPAGANATLLAEGATASFDAALPGSYVVGLTVTKDGATASEQIVVDARALRDVTLTTTAGVLHVRPVDEALCGPLDCYAGACTAPGFTAAGGGVLVEDLALGTFRASLVLPADAVATDAVLSVSVGGALVDELPAALTPGDAVDVVDLVATLEGGVALEAVGALIAGGACP